MSDNKADLRVVFEKMGTAAFISHLELMGTLGRAFRRAKIKMVMSQGFNKRPYLSTARPLSLGYESKCEICDTKLLGEIDINQIANKLNLVLPPGINVLTAYRPINEFTKIKFSEYNINISFSKELIGIDAKMISDIFASPVMVTKRTKSEVKETDISGDIKSLISLIQDKQIIIKAILKDEASGSLNPAYVIKALSSMAEIPDFVSVSYMRERFLKDDLSEFK